MEHGNQPGCAMNTYLGLQQIIVLVFCEKQIGPIHTIRTEAIFKRLVNGRNKLNFEVHMVAQNQAQARCRSESRRETHISKREQCH